MRAHAWRAAVLAIAVGVVTTMTTGAGAVPQGFGAGTPGGAGGAVVRVTSLADDGPGSLRQALRSGRRTVVFDVAGEIALRSHLFVQGAFVTIDGFTAPSPGITLRHYGLVVRGSRGAHDVVVRGLRVREAAIDGIQVSGGAFNVLIEHVSIHDSADGNIDITEGARDVTVAWSILAGTRKNMLIKYDPARVTLHHNLFVDNGSRNPQARIDERGTWARDTTLDMRNNVIAHWQGYGTLIWSGAWANVVANFYSHAEDAITVADGRAYVAGNLATGGRDVNRGGTEPAPFPAPPVETTDACTAAHAVLAGAGPVDLDDLDVHSLARVALTGCPPPQVASPPSPPPPPPPAGEPPAVLTLAIAGGADDGREHRNGKVQTRRPQLALGDAGLVALRFAGVPIPPGAVITSAVLEVIPSGGLRNDVHLYYLGEYAADSAPLGEVSGDFSRRSKTLAFVDEVPAAWVAGQPVHSPDLAAIVQEIVSHPGWQAGHSLTLFIGDDGRQTQRKVAGSEGRGGSSAAQLTVRWQR